MPSPFPGMDPYLEAQGRWPGFHTLLIGSCSELLNRDLPETYVAQADERIALVSFDDTPAERIPDILIGREEGSPIPERTDVPEAVGTLEPMTMRLLTPHGGGA